VRIRSSVEIEARPSTVFAWLADPDRARLWMTSVGVTEIVDLKPGTVGTTFREVVRDGRGQVEMRGVITAFEPDHRIAFHLDSRVNDVKVDYRVEPRGDGSVVSVDSDVRWRFPVNAFALLAGNKMRREILGQLGRELATLRSLCEGTNEKPATTI
jgi:uncharacterized protein YndB with AHSA1/START domain